MTATLFENLPTFPVALPDDELQLLAALPEWPTTQEVDHEHMAAAHRLAKRGLIKISRFLDDPAGTWRSTWAGKLPAASLHAT